MSGPPKPAGGWHQVPYAEASYWEARYGKEHQPFEWFLGYTALRRVLRAFLSKRKPVLQIGCGTSNVQEGMAKAGWSIHNVSCMRYWLPVCMDLSGQLSTNRRGAARHAS